MSKTYTTMSLDAIKFLCKSVKAVANVSSSSLISDTSIATNTTYSSYKIERELDNLEDTVKAYTDALIAGLNKLTKEVIDNMSLVTNENVLYLYKATDDTSNNYMQIMLINGQAIQLGTTQADFTNIYNKTESENKFAAKLDLKTLTTSFNTIKDKLGDIASLPKTVKEEIDDLKNAGGSVQDMTLEQYNELYNNGSIVIDDETIKYDPETYYVINDDSTMLNITDTINSSSTASQIPNAKAVFDECKQGRLIDQSVINTYGTEMLKYPLGRWYINLNTIAVQFTDRPCDEAGILEIASIHPNGDPWAYAYMYRMYKYTAIIGEGTYLRDIDSGSIAGSIQTDTGWKKVCTTKVADVPWTSITPTSILKRGTIVYRVKHGICYVVMDNICSSSMSTNNQIIATGLPKPEDGISGAWYQLGSNVDSTAGPIQNLLIRLTNEGNINNYYGTNEVSYYGSFSYPVKES